MPDLPHQYVHGNEKGPYLIHFENKHYARNGTLRFATGTITSICVRFIISDGGHPLWDRKNQYQSNVLVKLIIQPQNIGVEL